MIRLIFRLNLKILFSRIRIYFRSTLLLRSIMPTIRSIIRMLISGVRLHVIIVSVTTEMNFSQRVGLALVVVLVITITDVYATCARLSKRISIIVWLRRLLIRFSTSVVLILMLRFLITLKSRWFILLSVTAAIILQIRGRGRIAISRPFVVSMVLRISRRWLISPTSLLASVK